MRTFRIEGEYVGIEAVQLHLTALIVKSLLYVCLQEFMRHKKQAMVEIVSEMKLYHSRELQ